MGKMFFQYDQVDIYVFFELLGHQIIYFIFLHLEGSYFFEQLAAIQILYFTIFLP